MQLPTDPQTLLTGSLGGRKPHSDGSERDLRALDK